jgi:PrtD family type I secretion system ABC transporter
MEKHIFKINNYLKYINWKLGSLFAFSAFINILLLIPAWYMLQVYDRVLTSYDENTLFGLTAIAIFLYLIYGLLERYRGLLLIEISVGLEEKITPVLYKVILDTNTKHQSSEKNALSDLNIIKQFLTGQPMLAFLDIPWIPVYLLTIAMLHPNLGLATLVSIIFLFILALLNDKFTKLELLDAHKALSNERRLVSNTISVSDSVQVMGMRSSQIKEIASIRGNYLNHLIKASYRGVNFSSVSKFSRLLIQSLLLGYGAYLAIHQEITAGMIIAASILLGRALAPIDGVISAWRQVDEFKKSVLSLDKILRNQISKEYSVELGRPRGRIELINVSLRLRESGKSTLDGVNLIIEAGESLAIVGPSGAGKTSLLKVISGIYKPSEGQVLIDGSDLAFRDHDNLGKYVGYLSQTSELLYGKISSNIARFDGVDNEAVLRAAEITGAHRDIVSLPEGYETELGDLGFGLSEGQKKKIGLARAIYRDPAMVYLDEPTAGLDDASILSIVKLIQLLKQQGSTLIYTTHQANLAQLSDKILVMVDGKIRKYGKSAEIIQLLGSKPVAQ